MKKTSIQPLATLVTAVFVAVTSFAAEKVIFFGAHPDDSEGYAGTAFLLAKNYEIHMVDLTRGELGLGQKGLDDASTAYRRTQEEAAASAYLGATVHYLGEVDGFACASDRAANKLADLLRELKPKAVFTHWPVDRHADHMQCAALLARAMVKTGLSPEVYYYEVLLSQTSNWHPIYSVDISTTMTNKVQMLRNYACQNVNDSLVREKIRQARLRGSSRSPAVAYAETFTTFDGHPAKGGVLELLKETARTSATGSATRTEELRAKLASGDRDYVFVAMHRGDWRNYPENSRDAIRSAIALGADIVELDARMTKDGRFVLLHDESLDRTTDGHGKVSDHTFAEVKALHLKMGMGGKEAKVTDYPVLSLEEALELARGKILVNIDKFTQHPREILEAVDKVGAIREVLVKSTLPADRAKELFGDYWKRVESGELLYMPVVQFCWGNDEHASKILPGYLSLEPRPTSMYEICLENEAGIPRLDAVKRAPGNPRIWINAMWDCLAAGRGEADQALPEGRILRVSDPGAVWGRMLGWGVTMIQSDYGAELLVYLNGIGRHDLCKRH